MTEFKKEIDNITEALGFSSKDASADQLLQAGQIAATLKVAEKLCSIVNMVAFTNRSCSDIANRLEDINRRLK